MNEIVRFLADVDLLADISREHLTDLARHARQRSYLPDDPVLVMDEPADVFHVVRSGQIAVGVEPPHGPPLIIEMVGPGEVVGVSWLLPPYRWAFAAWATEETDTIAVDAEPVRAMAERDPTFGLLLHKRFAAVIHHRLVSARVRALDLYGIGP